MIYNTIASVTSIIRPLINDQEKTDGRQIFTYLGDANFQLSKPFLNVDSIQVFLNGELVDPENYTYNALTNQIEIDFVGSGNGLVTDDIIMINYSYYKKYSDDEIEGYIFSALSYFVQYRYKKVFEVVDSTIIAIDDLDPTPGELYFIACIAAIIIDPQNVQIKLDGAFQITANRNKSDQEQIKDAFTIFTRFVGKIYFEQTDWRYRP